MDCFINVAKKRKYKTLLLNFIFYSVPACDINRNKICSLFSIHIIIVINLNNISKYFLIIQLIF